MTESDLRARQALSDMDRVELEDKHLRLLEETFLLKKHARSQEDKMKRMATKLLRLTADEKSEMRREVHPLTTSQLRQRDAQTEEYITDLQVKIRELEKQNASLKGKAMVLKHQVEEQSRRHTPYDHIQSRISTGIKKIKRPPSTTAISEAAPISTKLTDRPEMISVGIQFAGTCHNLLEGVRRDNQEMESHVLKLKADLLDKDAEIKSTKEKLRLKSMQLEEEKLVARQELQTQIANLERDKTDQEMDMIRLQREVRDSSNRMSTIRAKCTATEQSLEILRTTHSKVLDEMEALNSDLKRERDKVTQMELKVSGHESTRQALLNLEVVVEDMRRERDQFKQTNREIAHKEELNAAKHRGTITSLEEKINTLQDQAKADNAERSKTLQDLATERQLSGKLDLELRSVRDTYQKLKTEYESATEKLKFFEKESSLDWSEVEQALTAIRAGEMKNLDLTTTVDTTTDIMTKELHELRAWHADTINELEKTRKLLQVQHNINKDYKAEVESLKGQLTEQRQKYEGQLQEYVQLMDVKSARVKKLEGQLKDIAYGTRPYKVDMSKFEYGIGGEGGREEEGESVVELERGQNLLQFHIAMAELSPEALSCLSTSVPAVFVTLSYSDYETVVTPVLQGPRPNFGFTINFVVTVDENFIQHLQKSCIRLEVNQAMGYKYQLVALTSVKCRELVTSAGGKVHGRALLVGAETTKDCVGVGGVEYWMRLKLPITHTAKLHQDRSKALASLAATPDTPTSPPSPEGPDYNELSVTIIKCQGLPASDPVRPPSAYIMYKLYSFPDQDTPIIPHSCSPQFSDQHNFPLSMDTQLDQYLRQQNLELYVFDDDERGETEASYLGVAQVPLLPLSRGKPISGTFQLKQPSGESGGFVELSVKWKQPYKILPDTAAPPTQQATFTPVVISPSTSTESLRNNAQKPPASLPAAKISSGESSQIPGISLRKPSSESTGIALREQTASGEGLSPLSQPSQSRGKPAEQKPPLTKPSSGKVKKSKTEKSKPAAEELGKRGISSSPSPPSGVGLARKPPLASAKLPRSDELGSQDSSMSSIVEPGLGVPAFKNSLPPLKNQLPSLQAPSTLPLGAGNELNKTSDKKVRRPGMSSAPGFQNQNVEGTAVNVGVLSAKQDGGKEMTGVFTGVQTTEGAKVDVEVIHQQTGAGAAGVDVLVSSPTGSGGGGLAVDVDVSMEGHSDAESSLVSVTVTELSGHELSDQELGGGTLGLGDLELSNQELGGKALKLGDQEQESELSDLPLSSQGEGEEGSIGEEIEEDLTDLTDEDTMFEDTVTNMSDHLSDNSVLSSSEMRLSELVYNRKANATSQAEAEDENDDTLTLSASDSNSEPMDSKPITSAPPSKARQKDKAQKTGSDNTISITISSFSLEAGSSLDYNDSVQNVFVEYVFLDCDVGELETPSARKPQGGASTHFGYRKNFSLDSKQLVSLAKMLSSDGKIMFTLVSDPEHPEADCEELGAATLDLNTILKKGRDAIAENIDVLTLEEDPETIGHMTITVEALKVLRAVKKELCGTAKNTDR